MSFGSGYIVVYVLWCLTVCSGKHVETESSMEKTLIRVILERYKQNGVVGRPVNDSRVKMVVQYGLQMIQLLGLDENKQILKTNCWAVYRWSDSLLKWNASQYGGITELRIFPHQIWTPDIKLYNFADERLQEFREGRLVVDNTGNILWIQQALFRSTCQVEITYFPFDSQVCMLEFGSMAYDKTQLDLEWWIPDGSDTPMPYVDFSDYVPANDWFTDGEAERHIKHEDRVHQLRSVKRYRVREHLIGSRKHERYFPVLRYLIRIYRNPSFHLFILIVPCLLLSLLSLVVFWLPPDSAAKMMLGINIFVGFFVLLLLLAKSIPSAIKNFPIIGIFFCLNMVMVTLSIFMATWVVNLFYKGNDGQPVPFWIRRFIIDGLGRMLRIRQIIPLIEKSQRSYPEISSCSISLNETGPFQSTHYNKISTNASYLDDLTMESDNSNTNYNDEIQLNSFLLSNEIFSHHTLKMQQNKLKQNSYDIKVSLKQLNTKQIKLRHKSSLGAEWRTLALIIDRLFFIIYLLTLITIATFVILKTDIPDTTLQLINRNVINLY
ncbi:Neuronal acetylcholine receptor subunit alpha-3 [Schistosoma japonicum]|uniref:Neuronal acetylcholine receptor subunit alpha-3 n=1 Tax=Schistosoma japonicum TaxID=6182 RepID=A0A4Z2DAJ1_SCHJA|nr:Neuronal acetylcholine receptor subunit alpha-2 [Schistosoma japonicum]KAH8868531.1 Neuronal acetylcholine receptor subunit alpha-2 [Schistosoma japonicum]TNN13200.1 Neuronal acetylcholine receptor subunit alpha-3 [Schistosoma japonicum]